MSRWLGLLAALVPPVFAVTASAQTDLQAATVRVTVVDPSGGVMVGATVTLEAVSGAWMRAAATDERGEVRLGPLPAGRYHARVEADGFETAAVAEFSVGRGQMDKRVVLALARQQEVVTVRESDRLRHAFVTVLTPAQIDALPDDPEEMERVLREIAGPGNATIRVDGFTGVSLPPKSEIQSIRFRRDEFAAEHHARGTTIVDIVTRAGLGPLRGSIASTVHTGALDARNAFAPERPQEMRQQYDLQFSGPLWRDRTSFSARVGRTAAYSAKPIVAALIAGPMNDQVRQPVDQMSTAFRLKQTLPASHLLGAYVEHGRTTRDQLGVGGFSLAERAYSSRSRAAALGVVESGPVGRHLFNELRAQARDTDTSFSPSSQQPAVIVLDAFQTGGAQIAGARHVRTVEIAENLDIFLGGVHAVRTGLLFERTAVRSDVGQNAAGTFTFASLEDYAAARPTLFTRRLGDPRLQFAQSRLGWYGQDDMRVRPSLLLSAGIRQEWQNHVAGFHTAPRLGITWAPSSTTTVYSGAGVFYDWLDAETFEPTVGVDGERQWDELVLAPAYPDPFAAGSVRSLPRSRIELAPTLGLPMIVRLSSRLQHRPVDGVLLSLRYAEERGASLFRGRNVNAPMPDGSRPDSRFGNVIEIASTGRSSQRSLVFGLTATARRRGSATATYELASAANDADDPFSLPADSHRLSAEWGPAKSDVRHRVTTYVTAGAWKGVKLDVRVTASSAAPYTMITGRDDNGDGVVADRPAGVGRNSERGAWQRAVGTRLTWRRGFGPPAPGLSAFGTTSAGDVTIAAGPQGTIRRLTIVLYADAQNVFNHVNYSNYSGVITSPFFGRPTAALPGRQIQIGAQFIF